ncbi:MAG: HD domain-containing protein [Cyclobacteriaceae bacterium]|nr:HD domain-containing protein [Cyclobacteriaceae bacterium]
MTSRQVIEQAVNFAKEEFLKAEGGHDWWHTYRVWKTARLIAQHEKVNLLVVELGALLHDIADSKFHGGDEDIGPEKAMSFLRSINVEDETCRAVTNIVRHISFKGGNFDQMYHSKELDVVQDADRLDAIGAIGIARAFNYGGYRNRSLYDPDIKPSLDMSITEYKNNKGPTLNHFYEKLLRLKGMMKTRKGRELAEERHRYMEEYLKRFLEEWEGTA